MPSPHLSHLEEASRSPFPVHSRRRRQDEAAVKAALTLPWSSGQAEGQVNKLKLIKRQMYGRASFDPLRRRVPLAA